MLKYRGVGGVTERGRAEEEEEEEGRVEVKPTLSSQTGVRSLIVLSSSEAQVLLLLHSQQVEMSQEHV